MFAVAIVGILASVAVPAYNEQQVTAQVSAASKLIGQAKDAHRKNESTALGYAGNMTRWNARLNNAGLVTETISSMLFTVDGTGSCATCGEITVTFNPVTVGSITAATNTLVYKPYTITGAVAGEPTYTQFGPALLAGNTGAMGWACVSDANLSAVASGFGNLPVGTLPNVFAPSECR
jgi:type IV pilus assembly protein PilA